MGKIVGVAGATGALGKEVIEVLQAAPWDVERVIPLARPQSTVGTVTFRGEQIAVDDLAHVDVEALDVLIVCTPAAMGGDLVKAALSFSVPVVDASGSQFADLTVPVLLPWLPAAADVVLRPDVAAVPGATATLLSSVVGPLAAAGMVRRASATVMVPASAWGRAGVEELSQQVVAMFNSGTPPRKVFDQGLAFDLVPVVGTPAPSGWSDTELRAMTEIARLTGVRTDVTLVGVPVFSGLSAQIRVETPADCDAERVSRVLENAGVSVAATVRRIPRPRRIDGEPFAAVGRIRAVPGADAVLVWAVMDNLRTVATAAVGLAGRLARGEET